MYRGNKILQIKVVPRNKFVLEFIPFNMEENMDMNKNFDAFDNYFMKFDIDNEHNIYKYHHSYRVMSECENIAKSLFFDEESINLAALIGLPPVAITKFFPTTKLLSLRLKIIAP